MKANLKNANLSGANLEKPISSNPTWRMQTFPDRPWETDLQGTTLNNAKSLYKAKFDLEVLSKIKTNWPEKLATIWDDTKKDWVMDNALLAQIKRPNWQGWPEEKEHGK